MRVLQFVYGSDESCRLLLMMVSILTIEEVEVDFVVIFLLLDEMPEDVVMEIHLYSLGPDDKPNAERREQILKGRIEKQD